MALFKQLAQVRLRDALAIKDRPQTRFQCGIERLASLGNSTVTIHAGGIMANDAPKVRPFAERLTSIRSQTARGRDESV